MNRRDAAGWAVVAALALIAGGVVLYSTSRYGPGVTPDSVAYATAAENLRTGRGFRTFDGSWIDSWPPLYPATLAVLRWASSVSVENAARILNALCYALMVVIAAFWTLRTTRSWSLVALACFGMLVSQPLLLVSAYMWSESLFLALTMMSLTFLALALESTRSGKETRGSVATLLTSAVLAAAACMTRYAGVALVAAALVIVLWFARRRRLGFAALYVTIAVLPLLMWTLHNRAVTGHAMGPRASSVQTLHTNVRLAVYTAGLWFVPSSLNPGAKRSGLLSLLVVVAALVAWRRTRTSPDEAAPSLSGSLMPPAVLTFGGVYAGYMVASASTIAFDELNDRLLAALYPAILMGLVWTLHLVLKAYGKDWRVPFFLWSLCGLFVLYGGNVAIARILFQRDGLGFSRRTYRNSLLMESLKHAVEHRGAIIFANDPAGIYWRLGAVAKAAPRARVAPVAKMAPAMPFEELDRAVRAGNPVYYVQFVPFGYPGYFIPPDQVAARYGGWLEKHEYPDGCIYRLR